ncbi:MAG: DUF4920 domain-containing protein [Flavobacteriales bacterium]|nr:DUF4920 domain-containing protein [Flavobacteriales bacterium]
MRALYLILIAGLVGCGAQEQPKLEETSIEETESVTKNSYMSYGSKIKADGALKIEELSVKMQDKDTLLIKLEAVINETCSKKGCWMTVDVGSENDMMVRFADYGFFVPTDGQQGKTAIFEGKAFRDTVDVETLRHYAEDAGKSQEEIDQITESEIAIAFVADGVIIKE